LQANFWQIKLVLLSEGPFLGLSMLNIEAKNVATCTEICTGMISVDPHNTGSPLMCRSVNKKVLTSKRHPPSKLLFFVHIHSALHMDIYDPIREQLCKANPIKISTILFILS